MMGLIAKDTGGGDYVPAPAGMHTAVCCQIIDIGTQFSKFYGSSAHKVLIGWELANETDDDGNRMLVWKRYTLSLNVKSKLHGDLVSWRGRAFTEQELEGFDLTNILGAPCQLNIVHQKGDDGKTVYANVQSVNPMAKGSEKPRATKKIVFDIDDPDMAVFETFGDNLKETIKRSDEWQERERGRSEVKTALDGNGKMGYEPIEDDDIPF